MLDLLEVVEHVQYSKNEMVIKSQTYGTKFYIVKRGQLRIYNEDKSQPFEKTIFPGDYFGETSIFGDGMRLANVQAETEVELLQLEKFDFLWVFSDGSLLTTSNSDERGLVPQIQLIKNLSDMRKNKLAEFINVNQFVKSLHENQKCKINMFIREKKTKKGEVMWKKGTKPNFCFFIRQGKYQVISFYI